MHNTGCALKHDRGSGALKMNQTAFTKNIVKQCKLSATSNFYEVRGVDLGPRNDGDSGIIEEFPQYRALVRRISYGFQL